MHADQHIHAVFFKSISCLHQSPVVSRGQTHQQQFHDKRFDLLSDLGGDIFAAPPNMNAGASSGFANFAHFNSHTSKEQTNKRLSNISKAKICYCDFWVCSVQGISPAEKTKYVSTLKTQESDLLRHKALREWRKWVMPFHSFHSHIVSQAVLGASNYKGLRTFRHVTS